MISEDDVIDGLANDYKVIYVTQQYVQGKALTALKKWVEAGGTVVAMCGGGFMDEFQKPNPEALSFYGVKSQKVVADPQLVGKYLLKENQPFLTKQDLPLYEPFAFVEHGKAKIPVIVWRQAIELGKKDEALVVHRFDDGKPAVITKSHGKGHSILFGFLPGQAWLKSALPVRPADRGSTDAAFAHFLPPDGDLLTLALIIGPARLETGGQPVNCSEPLVESTCIDSPGKLAVPLMNYTGKPIERLIVSIRDVKPGAKVKSVERGELKATFADGAMIVELPINVADMLLIDR
jgi:hypothetical protein